MVRSVQAIRARRIGRGANDRRHRRPGWRLLSTGTLQANPLGVPAAVTRRGPLTVAAFEALSAPVQRLAERVQRCNG
jgi:hypothetical protein